MGKGAANPVEQWRKKEKKKLQKKHTEDKIKARSALLMQKEPDRILADIRRIQWAERQGIADPKMLAQKKRLLEIHKNVSEKKQLEIERKEKEKAVVVKGLTKIFGRSAAAKPASDSGSKIEQELKELQEAGSMPADDDGILAAPPNLAPPRMPAPAPWAQPAPTLVYQPHGPPLPLPGTEPMRAHHGVTPAPHHQPPAPVFKPPPRPSSQSTETRSVVMQSAPVVRSVDICTDFVPTNMLLNRRRPAPAAPARKPKPAASSRPATTPAKPMESAESAYNAFLSEIGD